MAYIKFRPMLGPNSDTEYEAEWFTDADAKEYFDGDESSPEEIDMYYLELTDAEVQARNDAAMTFFDFVSRDYVVVGEPRIE
jgi:hypothetical protein